MEIRTGISPTPNKPFSSKIHLRMHYLVHDLNTDLQSSMNRSLQHICYVYKAQVYITVVSILPLNLSFCLLFPRLKVLWTMICLKLLTSLLHGTGLPRRLRSTSLLWKGNTQDALALLKDDVLVADPGTRSDIFTYELLFWVCVLQ